jgi:signal transduction histidine kinase
LLINFLPVVTLSQLVEASEIENLKTRLNHLQADLSESQHRIASLHVLQEVAGSLTSELNLEPLLHKILRSAVEVMAATAGSLILLDELTDELVFAVVEGGGGESLQGVRMARDKGIAGWVATNRKPLIVDDVQKDNRYYHSIASTFGVNITSLLCAPMISRNKLIGVIQVFQSTPGHYFSSFDQQLLTSFASQAAIAIENARLYENLKAERDRLVVAEDEIRKQMARDLHDGPTQFLASIVMSLGFIRELIKRNPDIAINEVGQCLDMAEKALKQLRTMLFDLRPIILETQGLIPALELYAERQAETEQLNLVLTVEDEFERLSPRAEETIFAVIQEAVNNAKKYAHASQIDLILRPDYQANTLAVLIKDDGLGFDISTVKTHYDQRGSLGLLNMQERSDALNGTFTIHSEISRGTEVILTLPLNENLLHSPKEKSAQ